MAFSYLNRVSGSYSPVQKVLQEAKPLSDSVEDKRRSCKPAKKVNTSVIETSQCKGSKNGEICFLYFLFCNFHFFNLSINNTQIHF